MFNKHKKLLSSSSSDITVFVTRAPPEASPQPAPAAATRRILDSELAVPQPPVSSSKEAGSSEGTQPCPQGGTGRGPAAHCRGLDTAASRVLRALLGGKTWDSGPGPGTHPRPRQPSLRWTSLCSSPSSKERSSGEKESGSSTACRRVRCQRRPQKSPRLPTERETGPASLLPRPQRACLL